MNYYNASNNSNEREQFTKRTPLGYHIIHIGIVREVMTISIESSI